LLFTSRPGFWCWLVLRDGVKSVLSLKIIKSEANET
jgi:hypothetical protein